MRPTMLPLSQTSPAGSQT